MADEHLNDIFTDAGFSKFQLFYVEAMMNDSSCPFINRIRPLFEKMSMDEFINLTEKIIKVDDYELSQQFFYFLILFRDMKNIQEYMNSGRFTIGILERFIIFTFVYCNLHDNTTENIMDEVLFFINRERLFELTLKSKYIQGDKLLLFVILSRFGRLNDMIRKYRETTDYEKERSLSFKNRDMSRISLIVSMVKEMPDPVKAVEYFEGEHIFIDDMEKKVVLSSVTDPMMKNIFSKYELNQQ